MREKVENLKNFQLFLILNGYNLFYYCAIIEQQQKVSINDLQIFSNSSDSRVNKLKQLNSAHFYFFFYANIKIGKK